MAGILILVVGGGVGGMSDGFGDPPPLIQKSIRTKRIGVAIALCGIALAIGSAVRLYVVDK